MKLLSFDDLKPAKGIPYSKAQIWRLEKSVGFPVASRSPIIPTAGMAGPKMRSMPSFPSG